MSEFVNSGMRRSEFCQSRGLSFSKPDRHLKKRRWKRTTRSAPVEGQLVPVELAIRKPPARSFPALPISRSSASPELTPAAWVTQHS